MLGKLNKVAHDDTGCAQHVNPITEHGDCFGLGALRTTCVFFVRKRRVCMPKNQFQRMVYAFLTVLVTVHGYVFYSLYVVNGEVLKQVTGAPTVLGAIRAQGGVYMLGRMVPIWGVVLIEFCLAYFLECAMGSPLSFKLACRVFDPSQTHPVLFETALICATVGLMCPAMSFLAAWLYYPYYEGFHVATLLANWLKLVCGNLPFAFFSQLFFIQPLIRTVFGLLFCAKETAQQAVSVSEWES
jgi:hypothetical protein